MYGMTAHKLVVVAFALALAANTGCGKSRAEAPPTDGPAPSVVGAENIAVVAETTVASGPQVSGALSAEREARVRAELGGSILQVLAEPGQAVRPGQVLAQIEPQTAREQALFTEALVRSLENELRIQERNLDRDRRLAEAGALSQRQVEQDSLTVSQAEASLAEARARRVVADRILARSSVRAPFGGIVSARSASVGDVVREGAELFTIVDPSSLRLEAQVPAEALRNLRVGTAVQFTLAGIRDAQLTGEVSRIYPSVDPATGQVRVLVTIPNPGQRVVAGLYADGRVVTESRTGLALPLAAIDERAGRAQVARVTGGRLERVDVTLGLTDRVAEVVEVTAGVARGDTVLLGSPRSLPVGTPIRVRAAAEQATAQAQ
jgi:RND family efflux transporter MFP subunit